MARLTEKQLTHAIKTYARRHGYYARTVRAVSTLKYAAINEYNADNAKLALVLFLDGKSGMFQVHRYLGACLAGQPTCWVVRDGRHVWVKPGESVRWMEV